MSGGGGWYVAPAGEGGGGIPAEPRAGLGGPVMLLGSRGNASATGGNGMESFEMEEMLDLLLSPVRGPVSPFFGQDCIGQGQL